MLQVLKIRNVLNQFKTPDQFVRYYKRRTTVCEGSGPVGDSNSGSKPKKGKQERKNAKCKQSSLPDNLNRSRTKVCGKSGAEGRSNGDTSASTDKEDVNVKSTNVAGDEKNALRSEEAKRGDHIEKALNSPLKTTEERDKIEKVVFQEGPKRNIESLYELLEKDTSPMKAEKDGKKTIPETVLPAARASEMKSKQNETRGLVKEVFFKPNKKTR